MKKFVKIFATIVVLLTVVGCATTRENPYTQPSPEIAATKAAGFEKGYVRDPNSVRYDPMTTLGASVKEAAEVEVVVVFDYKSPSYKKEAKLKKCSLHIKSSDSSLSDVIKCKASKYGDSILIEFKRNDQDKSMDLYALRGEFQGASPWYYNTYRTKKFRTLRYVYRGSDPFK